MSTLWRLHIRPKGGACDARLSTQFCLDRNIIGMGWAISDNASGRSVDWEWYKSAAEGRFGTDKSWHSVWNLATEMQLGDLVWFRHTDGVYYLAEVTGSWEYAHVEENIPADIINFRPARIVKVGLADSVPGAVCSAFVPAKTLQRIGAAHMAEYSAWLVGRESPSLVGSDLLAFLSPTDLENLLCVFLQVQGWMIIPGTRRADTPHYEFVLLNRETGQRAILQAKSGKAEICAIDYEGDTHTFLFAASSVYGMRIPPNVSVISRAEIDAFVRGKPHLLPPAIVNWIGIIGWR